MSWDTLIKCVAVVRPILEAIAIVATPVAAFLALHTYRRNARLERAKWMKELYEKFYERPELKAVRDVLDGDDKQRISEMVEKESGDFTDYLNFFEFVAYLSESKQITEKEMRDLFDYYLRNLQQNQQVLNYIKDPTKGFEKLRKVVGKPV